MSMTRFTLVALLAFAGTTARAADPAADEVKKLQGEWRVVEVEARGKKAGRDDPDAKGMRFVIKDNELTVRAADGGGAERRKTFKLDPARTPKEIDITSLDGQEKDTTAACIYKLEGDRLTICMPYFTEDLSKRPAEFKAGADDGLMLITLEKVKAK
jgi:RNA polymerase sigma-70 factor (ECF subfamily)